MKNRILMFVGMLMAIILSAALGSCDQIHDHGGILSHADSVAVANIAQEIVNPTFSNPTEAQAYQMDTEASFREDSVFRHLTQKEIFDVSSVLSNRGQKLSVHDIVEEYTKNKKVYSNLPTELPEKVSPPVTSEEIDTIDTIVDGKRLRIIKNKEVYHD